MTTEKSLPREYFEALLIAVILATFVRTYVVQAFTIPTASMEESLLVGDHILVNKFVFAPASSSLETALLPKRSVKRGDVVVFRSVEQPGRDFVKRCAGLGGDQIEVIGRQLHVNGIPVDDSSYACCEEKSSRERYATQRRNDTFGPVTVPEGHLFFLGDNRDNSYDSRFSGPVPLSHVKGRALLVYWSMKKEGEWKQFPGSLGKLKQLSSALVHFFAKTRWQRTLHLVR